MRQFKDFSDEKLVELYTTGVNEAFDEFLNRYKDRVFTYIYHIVKDEDIANDIFQDTFVKVISMLHQKRYQENGKLIAWVTRIAHNLIIDHFRQLKSENITSTDQEEIDFYNRKDLCEENIEDFLICSQINADIRRLINTLPAPQREVLVMRFYKDMSFKEIAESTGVSINTALGRMRYAILNLRRLADEYHVSLTV